MKTLGCAVDALKVTSFRMPKTSPQLDRHTCVHEHVHVYVTRPSKTDHLGMSYDFQYV